MTICWTRTSVGSFVWNLTRSLFSWTVLARVASGTRFVGWKPDPVDPRATAANVPITATPTVAALHFFLAARNLIERMIPPCRERTCGAEPDGPTPVNDARA